MNFVYQVKKVQPLLAVVNNLEYHWGKNLFFYWRVNPNNIKNAQRSAEVGRNAALQNLALKLKPRW